MRKLHTFLSLVFTDLDGRLLKAGTRAVVDPSSRLHRLTLGVDDIAVGMASQAIDNSSMRAFFGKGQP